MERQRLSAPCGDDLTLHSSNAALRRVRFARRLLNALFGRISKPTNRNDAEDGFRILMASGGCGS